MFFCYVFDANITFLLQFQYSVLNFCLFLNQINRWSMSTSYSLIQELVTWVEKFTDDHKTADYSMEDFLIWMNSKVLDQDPKGDSKIQEQQINMELCFLLIMQNRYYKIYAKQALADSELSSPDSFSFLYHLSLVDSYRKMELVKMHVMEAPSGIEVLKRLLAKGYIEEFDDPDDKRARRINITRAGKEELHEYMPLMQKVFQQMAGRMDRSEKLHFIAALRKINDYHMQQDKHLQE